MPIQIGDGFPSLWVSETATGARTKNVFAPDVKRKTIDLHVRFQLNMPVGEQVRETATVLF